MVLQECQLREHSVKRGYPNVIKMIILISQLRLVMSIRIFLYFKIHLPNLAKYLSAHIRLKFKLFLAKNKSLSQQRENSVCQIALKVKILTICISERINCKKRTNG